jgi:magnesium transporter
MSKARDETAARCMVRSVPTIGRNASCAQALDKMRERRWDYGDCVIVLDEFGRAVGAAPAVRLLAAPAAPISEVMERRIPRTHACVDQERAASYAIVSPLSVVLVVDDAERFLGLVTPGAALSVLRREHIEDLHRLTGVMRETQVARAAIESPPLRRARHRLPWLLVGLAGSVVAALVMAQFELLIAEQVAVAFFVPGVVYLADAMGTQTEAIAVRGLSLSHQPIGRLLANELATGLLIGVALAVVAFIGVWAAMQDVRLAMAVAVALVGAGAIATVLGLTLPWAFERMGLDPAYGSGPLGTVAQDVLSLIVYFTSATVLL